ncbi:MAG: tail fiber domain-containing protein [Betaproteobacteria bacterium]|nr:tail fiber domain-containing protein [Betaproteobacteria bacterium]
MPFDQPYYLGIKVDSDDEMTPRQFVAASPYAIRSATTDALAAGVTVPAGSLTGVAPVASIPDLGASYIKNGAAVQAASNFNISGNGTAGGTLSGNLVNATMHYQIGADRILGNAGTSNLFAGVGAGLANISGAGGGSSNSFFGASAGQDNLVGSLNSFFGASAGQRNLASGSNSFFGAGAGQNNNFGGSNSFFGAGAGSNNTVGGSNTVVGSGANVASEALFNATAVGAGAIVAANNSIVLGRTTDNVGVGTTSPAVKLHVSASTAKTNTSDTRALAALTNEPLGANGDPNNPFGLDVRLVGGAALANREVWLQSTDFNTADGGSIVLQPLGGNVGIGATNPTKAKLEINGFSIYGAPASTLWNGPPATSGQANGGASIAMSMYANATVGAAAFAAFSDERIKRIVGRSDGAQDLLALAGIEVTDYAYIDTVGKGTSRQKKVIAQQVEKVFPQAVSRITDVVPDIYRKAAIRDGWVLLATNLKRGERVRLIGDKMEAIHEVLEVAPGKFRTGFVTNADAVFVFGREVKDFRMLDYEAIAMLNVSATQELKRRLEQQTAEIAALRQQMAELRGALMAKLAN